MLSESRKITRDAKQAIMMIHLRKFRQARKKVKVAIKRLFRLKNTLKRTPELRTSGALSAANEELAEAMILLSLEDKQKFPRRDTLPVSSPSFVLGLADVVGELRRRTLDSMRTGNVKAAEDYLRRMEEIYSELLVLDEHIFSVLPGLRRKCDTARHLVEITRADVTIESRRNLLEIRLMELERKVSYTKHNKQR